MKKVFDLISKHYILHLINVLMIILGCFGIVGNDFYSLYFPSYTYISLWILCFIGILFYMFYQKYQHLPQKICVLLFISLVLVMILLYQSYLDVFIETLQDVIRFDYFLNFEELLSQDLYQIQLFYHLLLLLLGLPIVYLIVSLICTQRYALIKIIILIILFIFPVIIRHDLSSRESYCFIIFISYQFIFSLALKYQKQQYCLRVVLLSFLCMMTFFASLYLEDNPLFQQDSTSVLTQITDWFAYGRGQQLTSTSQTGMSSDIDGSLPSGNIQMSRATAIRVQADIPFSSYLRAYSLADYADNEWHEAQESYENSDSLSMYTQYLSSNFVPSYQTVRILPQRNYDFQFLPYFFSDNNQQYPVLFDSYVEYQNQEVEVIYQYEEDPNASQEDGSFYVSDRYDYDYEDYVYETYLNVPESLDESLSQLLDENDVIASDDMNASDAVSDVRALLAQQADYNLNAGTLPTEEDFVSYFLFENHKGSCTHFATAGALILRELGIPTRYVRGYVMNESDFHNGEARIPQYRSHAWIEVFENEKGWVPYEMTPSDDGQFDAQSMSEMLDENVNQSQEVTNQAPVETPDNNQIDTNPQTTQQDSHSMQNIYKAMMIVIMIVCLLLIYRYITTHLMQIKTRRMNNNQKVIAYYLKMKRLCRNQRPIDERIQSLAYKAQFSSHQITAEEYEECLQLYHQLVHDIDQSLKWYKKWIFRYILGYK